MSKEKEEKELTGRSLTDWGNITGPGDGPTDGKDKDLENTMRPIPGSGTTGGYPLDKKP